MKKITFIINTLRGGGAERVVSVLSSYLSSNYDVEIITTSGNIVDYQIDDKVSYVPIEIKAKNKLLQSFCRFRLLLKLVKEKNPDIIIAFLPGACVYGALCKFVLKKFKFIVSERMDPYQNPESNFGRWLRNIAFLVSDGMVFQTKDAQNYFKFIKKPSRIIYNPLKLNLPKKTDYTASKKIISAIRLEKQKNPFLLIDAFISFNSIIDDYILEIYGDGSLRVKIESYIKEKNMENKIKVFGFESNIHEKMKISDFFVLPSNYEGMSNSMIEALAIGLPVISTNHPIGGAKEIINSDNGILVPVNDLESMVNSMVYLAQNDEIRIIKGKNAQKVSNQLESGKICSQWEQFILDIYENK